MYRHEPTVHTVVTVKLCMMFIYNVMFVEASSSFSAHGDCQNIYFKLSEK